MNKLLISIFLSASLLSVNASAQDYGSPANSRLCYLMGGLAGAVADEKERGTTYEALLPVMGAMTKDSQSKQDQLAMLKLIYDKKMSGSEARREIYFRCMLGEFKSAYKL